MKRITKFLALVLAMLMLAAPVCTVSFAEDEAVYGDGAPAPESSSEVTSEEAPIQLPASCTLVGTEHLPPICSQGAVGCCASASITYMQFTNAVSRYLHSIDPDIVWNPSSGDYQYIFSPKFTYQYSGAGTEWVYLLIKDQGCLTMDKCNFHMVGTGFSIYRAGTTMWPETAAWEVGEGMMKSALSYRLTGYEQIWLTKSYLKSGKVAITTTEKGQELVRKIKEALVGGNVVVTGGYPSRWVFANSLVNTGSLAKSKKEAAIIYAAGDAPGGHQVSIVGYDDDITCRANGVVLKGAFLIANSWDTTWQNDGYCWMMYDAFNEVSEYDKLNVKDRTWTMDQVCFLYWDKDIEIGLPDVMIDVEVESSNKEGAAICLIRKSVNEKGKEVEETFKPKMFEYGPIEKNYHPDYDTNKVYSYSGKLVKDGSAPEVGYFTVNMTEILSTIPEGKTFGDYEWGVRLYSAESTPVKFTSVKMVRADGTVIADLDVGDGISIQAKQSSKSEKFYFDLDASQLTLPEGEFFTAEKVSGNDFLKVGESYSFKLVPTEGYTAENAIVTANGKVITPDADGVYTVVSETKNVVEVTGVELIPEKPQVNPVVYYVVGGVILVAAIAVIAAVCARKPKKTASPAEIEEEQSAPTEEKDPE